MFNGFPLYTLEYVLKAKTGEPCDNCTSCEEKNQMQYVPIKYPKNNDIRFGYNLMTTVKCHKGVKTIQK